jgi:hypothetical protein
MMSRYRDIMITHLQTCRNLFWRVPSIGVVRGLLRENAPWLALSALT